MASVLYRLGTFSARHRLWTFVGWVVALATTGIITLTSMQFSDGGFEIPGTESSQAMKVLEQDFGVSATTAPAEGEYTGSLQLVVQAPEDGSVTDPDVASAMADARAELAELPHVVSVSDPLDPSTPRVSEDLRTAVVDVALDGITEENAEEIHESVVGVAEDVRGQDLVAEVGGTITNEVPEVLGPTEIVGALLAFGVLLLTFGSLAAAGANMGGALVGVGVGILGVMSFSAITPIGSMTPVLAVMLGLAVGIDYCLFILARFRSELAEGRERIDAIGRATGTAGSAVVFAGTTVIIALVGLVVVGIPFITEMGLAAAFAVLIAVLMALTLLPALAVSAGDRMLPRRTRRAEPSHGSGATPRRRGFLTAWIETVVRRPVLTGVAALAVLGVLAAPITSMTTALAAPGGEDPDSTQRAAYDITAEAFGEGTQSPLIVLVQAEDAAAAADQVGQELQGLDDVALVVPGQANADGDAVMLTVMAESGPLDEATVDLVHSIRDLPEPAGAEVRVTGSTAIGIDVDTTLQDALVMYIVLIVGLSLALLIVLFRSILVPLIATAGFLLSLGAGLGATVAVFQWGWLEPLFQAPQGNPLLSLLPILVTGILFGLAMDYQVFLVSRMHEAHAHGASPRDAIISGFRRSSVVVVAAATIMAAVFGGFALSPSSLVGSIALALTVGVVADAFIVRMILVPASLALLGRAAWWMPRWLDRVLPDIDAEGRGLEAVEVKNEEAPVPELSTQR
jgi:RND superfamily putative drug exporter